MAETIEPAVTWTVGDAGRLPFDDGEFDAVVSQFGLMFFPDQVLDPRDAPRREARRPSHRGGVGIARPFRGVSDLGRLVLQIAAPVQLPPTRSRPRLCSARPINCRVCSKRRERRGCRSTPSTAPPGFPACVDWSRPICGAGCP